MRVWIIRLVPYEENVKMKVSKIYSKNAAYQKFEVLKSNRNKRYKYNEFLVEGVRNINEAIRNHWEIASFIYKIGRASCRERV